MNQVFKLLIYFIHTSPITFNIRKSGLVQKISLKLLSEITETASIKPYGMAGMAFSRIGESHNKK